MKQTILVIFILTLVAALLLLLLWGGDGGLQAIYLWIAEQENAARGIDGITEASRLKVRDDAVRHFAFCYFNMSGFNPLGNLLFNATSIAWPLLWGLILLKVWDSEKMACWQKLSVTLLACLLTCTSDWSCAAPLAILMIGRNRGCFHKQMLWMMAIISLYAVAFFIFHSPTYGMVHLACWLAVPLLAMYNGQRGRLKWLGKFFYYYYPAHMAVIGLLTRCFQ